MTNLFLYNICDLKISMKYFKLLLCFILFISICCYGEDKYNVFQIPRLPVIKNFDGVHNTQTLFILDYSNSMNELIADKTKYHLLIDSIKALLPQISDSKIGIRIYGHRWGITPMDACRASNLVLPVENNNSELVPQVLKKYHPRGMTPITYSLKQAVKNDFKYDENEKHIILITDGGENCDESPCKYAMELIKYRKDIKIDVIALNLDNEDDLDQLRCTANVTGGKLYSANTQAELVKNLNNAFYKRKKVKAEILY